MVNAKGLIAVGPPGTPSFVLILRIVALVLSVACFVAGCYNVSLARGIFLDSVTSDAPGGLTIFTCIWTWIVVGLDIAFLLKLHKFYYRVAFFICYILTLIFWLVTWAVAAAGAGDGLSCSDNVCTKFGGSAAAIAALGAITWIVLLVTFVFWTLAALRDAPAATANTTELGEVKHNGSAAAPAVAGAGAGTAPVAGDADVAAGAPHHGQQQYPQGQYPEQHQYQQGQYPPQGQYPEQQQGQYPPQGYPEPQGTPGPYQQQQPSHNGNAPYPEQPVGYPQEPHHHQSPPQQYPPQQGGQYPQ